jgi:hypothetical protein
MDTGQPLGNIKADISGDTRALGCNSDYPGMLLPVGICTSGNKECKCASINSFFRSTGYYSFHPDDYLRMLLENVKRS